MSIGDDIKQEAFDSVYEALAISLMATHSWYVSQLKSALRPYGLSPEQYNVLRILNGAKKRPVNAAYLKERMIDKGSNVTRLIDKLEKKAFVTRCLCATDRRQMDIDITEEGVAVTEEIKPVLTEFLKVLEGVEENEAARLVELLDRLRN